MQFVKVSKLINKTYKLIIHTTGQHECKHKIEYLCNDENKLSKLVICCEVLIKSYQSYKSDDYVGQYFDVFKDKWPCDSLGNQDKISCYEVFFYDETGKYSITIDFNGEDRREILENTAEYYSKRKFINKGLLWQKAL